MGNKIKINLRDAEKIKKFVQTVRGYESDVDIMTATAICDAKSILGVYALDLFQNTYVRIISDNKEECEKFQNDMKEFV